MTQDTSLRELSVEELDAVSGGQLVGGQGSLIDLVPVFSGASSLANAVSADVEGVIGTVATDTGSLLAPLNL